MIVMIDAGLDLGFEITWQEVVFLQNAVLQGLMPTFDLALGLGTIGRSTRVLHTLALQPFSQFTRDVVGTVVAEQRGFWMTWTLSQPDASKARSNVSVTSWVLMFPSRALLRNTLPGSGAVFPRDDVAAVILEGRAEIKPPPADDLQIGKVRLPQLIDGR